MTVTKTHPGVKEFIADTKKIAKKNKIKIRISKAEFVRDAASTSKSIGYFDSHNRELASSNYNHLPTFVRNFVHESCHMDQFLQNRYLWDKCEPGYNLFFDWIEEGTEYPVEVLDEAVHDIIRIELDCEKRSVDKIEKYNLPLDVKDYIKRANAYLYGYLFFRKHKIWIPAIYNNAAAVKASPGRFAKNYKHIPRNLEKIFNRYI